MVLTIAAAVFVFGLLVLVHELGHFATAKMTGMRVDEFAIGFGPKLVSFQKSRRSKVEGWRVGYVRAYWIGSFMSGQPSCAMTEPSQNWTIEWMMLCGWTTTWICP